MIVKDNHVELEDGDVEKLIDSGFAREIDYGDYVNLEILEPKYAKCPDCGEWIKFDKNHGVSLYTCKKCKVNWMNPSIEFCDDESRTAQLIMGYLDGKYRR